jgi:hypothetical protein
MMSSVIQQIKKRKSKVRKMAQCFLPWFPSEHRNLQTESMMVLLILKIRSSIIFAMRLGLEGAIVADAPPELTAGGAMLSSSTESVFDMASPKRFGT